MYLGKIRNFPKNPTKQEKNPQPTATDINKMKGTTASAYAPFVEIFLLND